MTWWVFMSYWPCVGSLLCYIDLYCASCHCLFILLIFFILCQQNIFNIYKLFTYERSLFFSVYCCYISGVYIYIINISDISSVQVEHSQAYVPSHRLLFCFILYSYLDVSTLVFNTDDEIGRKNFEILKIHLFR